MKARIFLPLTSLVLLLASNVTAMEDTATAATASAYERPTTAPATAPADEAVTPEDYLAAIEAVSPSLVRVEYTLKYDKGEAPRSRGRGFGVSDLVNQERPLEVGGFLVGDTKVVTSDVMIHPRFVKDVAVRFGDQLIPAKIGSYCNNRNAVVLELDKPFKGARPLAFDADVEPPYLGVSYSRRDGSWTVSVKPLSTSVSATETGRKFVPAPSDRLIVDEQGAPVAISMRGELPVDDSWKVSPLDWPRISADEMAELLRTVEATADAGLPRVTLSFRSPRKQTAEYRRFRSGKDSATERNVTGLVIDENTILVLAYLEPKLTARLERIAVHPPDGDQVPARFAHTLSDYGALIVKTESPIRGALKFAAGDIRRRRSALLMSAEVKLHGEKKVCYYDHTRIRGFGVGWRRHLYPEIRGNESGTFLFDTDGVLVAFPVSRREKISGSGYHSGERANLTAVEYVADVLSDLASNTDPSNVPLTEAEESRLAWMGLVLQRLDRELARINKVSHLTRDGQTGGLVSYVYPGSPADKAEIKPGMILLRLHAEDEPRPWDVTVEDRSWTFPWDKLGRIPVEAFENAPTPWPPAENKLTRKLTDLGFGKKFVAEFAADEGKVFKKGFEIVQSPPHYGSAPQYKSTVLGMTVRDLTYEVQRYLLKTKEDPGVIISKVEPGSKAAVGGIKPFEIITHVNDKPAMNVKDFEALVKSSGAELRLSVIRMTKGRIVRIEIETPSTAPTTREAPVKPAATAPAPGG